MQPSSLLRKLDYGATPELQIPLGEPGPITIAGLAAITLPGPIWDQLARAVTQAVSVAERVYVCLLYTSRCV